MAIPASFDPALPLKQSAAIHGIGIATAHAWRKKLGYVPERADLWTDDDIRRLKSLYLGNSVGTIAHALGRSHASIKSKAISLGLRKATGQFAPDRAPKVSGRAMGVADMAARHLQREAPVFRADADGTPNPKGKCWRYGNTVLAEADLLAKAERKGWKQDAWKELSGPVTIGEAANRVLAGLKVTG